MTKQFHDRVQAGRLLAKKLKSNYADRSDVLVLGLPRGGVPVAYEIAQVLQAPLDICIVRKLGVPGHQELAMGAIATGGTRILNENLVRSLRISPTAIAHVTDREQRELERRDRLYRGSRPVSNLRDRTVIVVDDGIATGSTLKAALFIIKQQQPKQIVVAVPVAPPDVCQELEREVDEVVCLLTPQWLNSISLWYEDFLPTTDEQVRNLLAQNLSQLEKWKSQERTTVSK
ncbi:phosphoribosyltransferase [Pleurocapsales cyanobacterium LEGE 10410]|nr:phosphoribosyltransferase [Pleurocapsales cyanobacterium LEGE 10410]